MDKRKVIEIIENKEWKRLELIAQFEQKQRQVKLMELI